MSSITFYGGIGEIGGNKFLLEHDNTRVFLDLGKNFDRESLQDQGRASRHEKM